MTTNKHQWTLAHFRRVGREHLNGARAVLNASSEGQASECAPVTAGYLVHVALECSIKARLLYRAGCNSTDELKRKYAAVHDKLFQSKSGHDIEKLASQVRLEELLMLEGKRLPPSETWNRMKASHRPYSLRYGAERPDHPEVLQEIDEASKLVDVLLSGLGKLKEAPRKSKRSQ